MTVELTATLHTISTHFCAMDQTGGSTVALLLTPGHVAVGSFTVCRPHARVQGKRVSSPSIVHPTLLQWRGLSSPRRSERRHPRHATMPVASSRDLGLNYGDYFMQKL